MSFAGVSFVGDGRASRSASSISSVVLASGYHLLVVDGYSRTKEDTPNGKCLESRRFRVGGYNWIIEYYPNGRHPKHSDFISLFLTLVDESIEENVKVHYDFSFADQVDKQDPSSILATQHFDFTTYPSWGFCKFEKKEVLEQSKHLKDDCFTIRCDIIIAKELGTVHAFSAPFITVPPSDMCRHFGNLLNTKEGSDVVFEVSGERFTAHRCVLAARSTFFRAQLFGPMKDGTPTSTIHIDDMEAKVFKALLKFIYTDSPGIDEEEEGGGAGEDVVLISEEDDDDDDEEYEKGDDEEYEEDDDEECEDDDEDDEECEDDDEEGDVEMLEEGEEDEVLELKEEGEKMEEDDDNHGNDVEEKKILWQLLLVAADRYNLNRLKSICEEKLCAYIDTSRVTNFLVIAEKHHCRGLKEACLDFLRSHANMKEVITAGGLDHLPIACPSVLKQLITKFVS